MTASRSLYKLTNDQLRDEIAARMKVIQDRDMANRQKKNIELVGRCYKYDNGYSEAQRWPIYRKITGCTDGNLKGFQFEVMAGGTMQLESDPMIYPEGLGDPIPQSEFDAEWRKFVAGINEVYKPKG